MKWTVQAAVLIGALIGGCAMERGSGEGGDGGAVATREVARDEQPTTAGALRGSGEGGDGGAVATREVARDEQPTTAGALRGSELREGTCEAGDGSGRDLSAFRIGLVDPELRLCGHLEAWDGLTTDGGPNDVGVVVAKQGERVVFRYPLVRQVGFGAMLAVYEIGLVQPDDDGLGPYFLIVYPVGAHSSAYEVVDLKNSEVIHSYTAAYMVELLELDTQRVYKSQRYICGGRRGLCVQGVSPVRVHDGGTSTRESSRPGRNASEWLYVVSCAAWRAPGRMQGDDVFVCRVV